MGSPTRCGYGRGMDSQLKRPRAVGINHVALEVDDVDLALAFYGRLFDITHVERADGGAFVGMGDQFVAMFPPGAGEDRHFGLVVDDKEAARRVLDAESAWSCSRTAGSISATRSATACRWSSTTRSSSSRRGRCCARSAAARSGRREAARAELRSNGIA